MRPKVIHIVRNVSSTDSSTVLEDCEPRKPSKSTTTRGLAASACIPGSASQDLRAQKYQEGRREERTPGDIKAWFHRAVSHALRLGHRTPSSLRIAFRRSLCFDGMCQHLAGSLQQLLGMKGASETDDEPLWKMLFTNSCPVHGCASSQQSLFPKWRIRCGTGDKWGNLLQDPASALQAGHLAAADLRRHCRP